MKLFLDSSVLLSACGSAKSLSRLVTELAPERRWHLVSSAYCRAETTKNLGKLGEEAGKRWAGFAEKIEWVPNALTSKRPLLLRTKSGSETLPARSGARRPSHFW